MMETPITIVHTYSYVVWKARNDILHKDTVKSQKVLRKQKLQDRVTYLYNRGRANLTPKELRYFKLPLDQRLKKGIESMKLQVKLVEAIFKQRGQARQEQIDTWLTQTTSTRNWRDMYKDNEKRNHQSDGNGLGGRILDPG